MHILQDHINILNDLSIKGNSTITYKTFFTEMIFHLDKNAYFAHLKHLFTSLKRKRSPIKRSEKSSSKKRLRKRQQRRQQR